MNKQTLLLSGVLATVLIGSLGLSSAYANTLVMLAQTVKLAKVPWKRLLHFNAHV